MNRREFAKRGASFLVLGVSSITLLGLSQCNGEGDTLKRLREILTKLEAAFKLLSVMGLANEVVQAAAKYLESVAQFVNQAAETLEDAALSTAQRAAKILSLGAQVALPHFTDPRVQNSLLVVQQAVSLFLSLFQASNPPTVPINDKTRKTLADIERDASQDNNDVVKWAAAPHPTPS